MFDNLSTVFDLWLASKYPTLALNTPQENLIAGTSPPRGGFLFTVFPIKNPDQEDPPRSTWYKSFEGGPLSPDPWLGDIVNRQSPSKYGNPPRGGVSFDQIQSLYHVRLVTNLKVPHVSLEHNPGPRQFSLSTTFEISIGWLQLVGSLKT